MKVHVLPHFVRASDLIEAGVVPNRRTLSRWVASGYFPVGVQLGPNIIGWRIDDVERWVRQRESGTRSIGVSPEGVHDE